MGNTLVSTRMPKTLLKKAEQLVQEKGYASTQELIREALREHIAQHEKESQLAALWGAGKNTARPATKKELAKLAKQYYA